MSPGLPTIDSEHSPAYGESTQGMRPSWRLAADRRLMLLIMRSQAFAARHLLTIRLCRYISRL